MGVDGQRHAPVALPPGKTRSPLHKEAGWASEPVTDLKVMGNFFDKLIVDRISPLLMTALQ